MALALGQLLGASADSPIDAAQGTLQAPTFAVDPMWPQPLPKPRGHRAGYWIVDV